MVGIIMSREKGYAPNVPSYFRVEDPEDEDSHSAKTNGEETNRSSKAVLLENLCDGSRIGKVFTKLIGMVRGYNPEIRRKVLNQRGDFLYLTGRFDRLLEESRFDDELKNIYKQKYAELINTANQKSDEAMRLRGK
jgi:hypothetical protein